MIPSPSSLGAGSSPFKFCQRLTHSVGWRHIPGLSGNLSATVSDSERLSRVVGALISQRSPVLIR